MNAVNTLKNVFFTAMLVFGAVGFSICSAHASITTAPENHLLATLNYVELEAEEGDKNLQLFLARAYFEGANGLEQNSEKGLYWLEKAAVDTPQVQKMIGDLYQSGQMLPQDLQKAFDWYLKAANSGSVKAMVLVGSYYASGMVNGKMDCPNALNWYKAAMATGSLESKRNLVWVYATCPDEEFRDGELALHFAQEIIKRNASHDAGDYDNLAAAYAECGNFKAAVNAQQAALNMLGSTVSKKRLVKFEQRLQMYKQHQTIATSSL